MSNKGLFEAPIDEKPEKGRPLETTRKRSTSHIDHRDNTLGNLVAGNVLDKTLRLVDPAECRMWSGHNRRYDLLSIKDEKIAELVAGLKTQGKQEIPAVVRAVNDDSGFKYEVVAGARRHWAVSWLRQNNYPGFMYLIEVRDMTDEECFRFSDLENRDRDDISDYERALDYRKAINLYYGGIDAQMAERIGYTRANLSYLLKLAELPDEIIEAFADPRRITVRNGRTLWPLLKESKTKRKLLAKAIEIGKKQKARVDAGENLLDGKEVMKLLQASLKSKPKETESKQFRNLSGDVVVKVDKNTTKAVQVTINRGENITSEDIKSALNELMMELM
jgi:ParB family transcriptional regulator, chromosome partitioning protein